MRLDELAPLGGRASRRRERRRFDRFSQMCENLPDQPCLRDEGNEPDVTAARWALQRKLLPNRAISLAQAIREVSCERGF